MTWFNAHENASFEVTGIVDPPAAAAKGGDLRLVLCGGGVCRQETFQVNGSIRSANGALVRRRSMCKTVLASRNLIPRLEREDHG